jgi:tetratricopeptide (TPR) repeat protein
MVVQWKVSTRYFCTLIYVINSTYANAEARRQHYRNDLKPFPCLSESCENSRPSFASREEWQKHMDSVHSITWPQKIHKQSMWVCEHPHHKEESNGHSIHALNQFSRPLDLENHERLHHGHDPKPNVPSDGDKREDVCPLCCFVIEELKDGLATAFNKIGDPRSMTKVPKLSAFWQHIAAHLQYLMVVSLRLHAVFGLHCEGDSEINGGGLVSEAPADRSSSPPGEVLAGRILDDDLPPIVHGSQNGDSIPNAPPLDINIEDLAKRDFGEFTLDNLAAHQVDAQWDDIRGARKLPTPEKDPLLEEMRSYSLWDRAYTNLRGKEPRLVESYDKLLSKELRRLGFDSLDKSTSPRTRRARMQTIIKNSLEQIDDVKRMYHVADRTVILKRDVAPRTLVKWKEFCSEIYEKFPEASLVWAGLCLVLPIIVADAHALSLAATEGFGDILLNIGNSVVFERSCEQLDNAATVPNLDLQQSMPRVRDEVMELYQHILEFHFIQIRRLSVDVPAAITSQEKWRRLMSKISAVNSQLYARFSVLSPGWKAQFSVPCEDKERYNATLSELLVVPNEEMDDLDEAIRVARDTLKATPKHHPDLARRSNNLGGSLRIRYSRTGVIDDLKEAINVIRYAVESMPQDDQDRAALLNALGTSLMDRYSRTGVIDDLEESIRVIRQSLEFMPQDHLYKAESLNNLGRCLMDRYWRTGAINDLEEAIRVTRQALEAAPQDQSHRTVSLNNLGRCLMYRYSRTEVIDDLEEAVKVIRQSLEFMPQDHSYQVASLNNLGRCLMDRYSRTGATDDLEEAIRVTRQALEAVPQDQSHHKVSLNNLGRCLIYRYSITRLRDDLEEAVRVIRQSVNVMPQDHPYQAASFNNLGGCFMDRYSRTGAIEDLEEAITAIQYAVVYTPQDHPDLAARLNHLGGCLWNRFSRTGAMADLEEAQKSYQRALRQANSATMQRIKAAQMILQTCARTSDWQQAYEASNIAVPLISRLLSRSLEYSDKQYMFKQVVGLASNAAAVALNAGKGPLVALELLEQGRGAFATSLEELRPDILNLQKSYPVLAEQFRYLRSDLELSVRHLASSMDENPNFPGQAQVSWRHETGKELDNLIIKIREQPGFEDFLKAPSERQMHAAASLGPIAVINVSEYRCDAILVEQHRICSLALPNLNGTEIKKKARKDDLRSPHILEWLWDVVMSPILDALGFTQPPSENTWPHVWWIPTGLLSKFPLHAAGYHTKHSEAVLDRVMSSYSSSIEAIIHGRQRPILQSPSFQTLLVGMEHTPGMPSLPFVAREMTILHRLSDNPIEPGRRKQDVTSHMRNCKIFHFAGHSYIAEDPSKSQLLLEDWEHDPLTVASLLEMNIREYAPFLAYLSASGTGQVKEERLVDESIHLISEFQMAGFRHVIGTLWEVKEERLVDALWEVKEERLVDESIHLISAFQMAGFRHVIGTLWEVNDDFCVDMTRITYETMKDGGFTDESVCRGLHRASRELRDRWLNKANKKVAPFVDDDEGQYWGSLPWVPYVHFGL